MTFDLFFPAIIVFVLMLIGVVLTVHEFNKLEKKERETRSDKRGGHDREKKR
jgi:large-conductance mechanosensitive channel